MRARSKQKKPLHDNPVAGAVRAPWLGFIEPQLATLKDEALAGDKWVHEIKCDGWRAQAHLIAGEAKILTRRGHDYTHRFKTIAADVARLSAGRLILDGEIVATDEKGMPRYSALIEDAA